MRRILLLVMLFASVGSLIAQEQAALAPPKVLLIVRENLKPGKAGTTHEKSESAFVSAFKAAKWPQHYLAADSQSGAPRSLFFVGYDSFAAWEKDTQATQKNPTLSAALDRASTADGELLSSYEMSTFLYRDDQSYHANLSLAPMRFFEITRFHVRPGHDKDWDEIVKIYLDNFPKAVSTAHWAVFEEMYGQGGNVYLVFNPMKSLAEVDSGLGDYKKFAETAGPGVMQRLSELTAAAVDEVQTNIFAFNPRESYAPDDWVKADPTFWNPKP
jgi:hypothetical protein